MTRVRAALGRAGQFLFDPYLVVGAIVVGLGIYLMGESPWEGF